MNMETGYELNVPVGDGNKDVKAIISNNEVIWERAIPTPKSGVAPLSFRATRAKPLLDWSITGNTYQAWTPSPEPQVGNNKLDNSKIEKSSTVTNFVYTDSSVSFGSMTVGATINSAEIKAGDTSYAFSFSGDTSKVSFALECYNSSHTYLGDANKLFNEENRAVMTTLSNTAYIRLVITTTVQGNVSLTNLMLNKGGTIMAFEPFKYLPNTGPCEVKGVGDMTENLFTNKTIYHLTIAETGILYYSATSSSVIVEVQPNTKYYIRTNIILPVFRIGCSRIMPRENSTLTNYTRLTNTNSAEITTESDTEYLVFQGSQSLESTWLNELYVGQGYKIPMATKGKNLLQLTRFNYGKNTGTGYMGVDVFESDGYTIIVKGHSNVGGGRTNRCSNPFILTAGEYTLSATRDITELLPYIQNSQNNALLGRLGSFTIETDVEVYLGFNVSLGADYDYTFSLMLNEGSEPLPYEPYHEPIATSIYLPSPLMADEVIYSTGKREVEWGVVDDYTSFMFNIYDNNRTVIKSTISNMGSNNFYCTHTVKDASTENLRVVLSVEYLNTMYISVPNRFTGVVDSDSDYDKLLKTKNYLNSIGMKVYYQLATPTTETVDVPAITTLKGNNVIDINTEVQPSNVSITYLSSGFEPQPLKTADGQMLYTNNNQPLKTLE